MCLSLLDMVGNVYYLVLLCPTSARRGRSCHNFAFQISSDIDDLLRRYNHIECVAYTLAESFLKTFITTFNKVAPSNCKPSFAKVAGWAVMPSGLDH